MDNRPSLSADRWMLDDGPEFVWIRTTAIADISRASRAIAAIGRILHNSIGDDVDGKCRSSIDNFTKQNLVGGIECITDFVYGLIENESFDPVKRERMEQERENG